LAKLRVFISFRSLQSTFFFPTLLNVDDFYVGGNSFTGTLPAGMLTLQGLQYIDLSMKLFSGTVPSNVQEWKELKQLYLHNNSFSGPIPVEFGVLKSLGMLYAWFVRFSPRIP